MDPETKDKIISRHGHLISSQRLNSVNIRHLVCPKKQEHAAAASAQDQGNHSKSGAHSGEDSGPPSPASGQIPNFGQVAPGIYRSSFPYACNLDHLKALKLKTIVTLVKTPNAEGCVELMREDGIQHYRVIIPPHKHGLEIPMESVAEVMRIIRDSKNQPLLIHCNKGKHRTGCMIACHRKLSGWKMDDILTEYRHYAGDKSRALDEAFIAAFDPAEAQKAIANIDEPCKPIDYFGLPTPPPSNCSMSSTSPMFSADEGEAYD